MVANPGLVASVRANAESVMPRGANTRSAVTSPRRLPVMASTTWPHQSMPLPYSHCVPGSNGSGVCSARREAITIYGWPCSVAIRFYWVLKMS